MTKKVKFTLIEIIVVIAVVVLLLGILLNAVVNAKKKAEQAATISNLRQIGIALAQYADDNNGFFPYIEGVSSSKAVWLILPYTGFNAKIFYPMKSDIYDEEKTNPLLGSPRELYHILLSDPSSVPSPGFAYVSTYNGKPLRNTVKNIPIAATFANQYKGLIYYLNSDGSVNKDIGNDVSFD